MTRRGLAGSLAALALLFAGYGCGRWAGLWGAPPIRVGTILPLSGPEAAVGIAMKQSMALAVDEVNRRGGIHGRHVELIALDEYPDRQKAVAAATRLADDSTVLASAAHVSEDAPNLTGSAFHRGGLVNLIPGAIDSILFEDGARHVAETFRIVPDGGAVMRATAKYQEELLGLRHFGLFHEQDFVSARMAVMFREALRPPASVDVVELTPADKSFDGYAKMAKGTKTDAIFFAGAPTQAARFLASLRAASLAVPFHLATKFPPLDFARANDAAEGVTATFVGLLPEDSAAGKKFLDSYAATGAQEPPGVYGVMAYGAMQVLLTAIDRSALTRRSVLAALKAGTFETILGAVRFDGRGQARQPRVAIYQVQRGRWVPIYVTGEEGKLVPFTPR